MTQKEIDIYLKKVKRNCPFPFRKKLLVELREDIMDYMENHPEGTVDDMIGHFGAPETFSYNYVLAMENDKRQEMIKKSRWIKIWTLTVLLIWLVIVAIKAIGDVRENAKHAGYYYGEILVEDDEEDWE